MVLVMGDKLQYSCYFVGCCSQDVFNITCSNLVQFPSSFFSSCFVSVYMGHPYSNIDKTAAWKEPRFILSDKSDFHMINSLSIAVHAFTRRILTSLSVDEMMLPGYVNLSTETK